MLFRGGYTEKGKGQRKVKRSLTRQRSRLSTQRTTSESVSLCSTHVVGSTADPKSPIQSQVYWSSNSTSIEGSRQWQWVTVVREESSHGIRKKFVDVGTRGVSRYTIPRTPSLRFDKVGGSTTQNLSSVVYTSIETDLGLSPLTKVSTVLRYTDSPPSSSLMEIFYRTLYY